jgi:hypothetical protein
MEAKLVQSGQMLSLKSMEVCVRTTDYSDFDPDRCFNGDNYCFATIYVPIGDDKWGGFSFNVG